MNCLYSLSNLISIVMLTEHNENIIVILTFLAFVKGLDTSIIDIPQHPCPSEVLTSYTVIGMFCNVGEVKELP